VTEKRINAGDPESVRKQKLTAKDILDQQQADLRGLLAQPAFRRYIWRHMNETCGLLKSAANPNGSIQSLNIGMQDVGRALWGEIEAADALMIPKMMQETFEAQR